MKEFFVRLQRAVAAFRQADKAEGDEVEDLAVRLLGQVLYSGDVPEIPVDPPAGARSLGMSQGEYLRRTALYYVTCAATLLGAYRGGIPDDLPLTPEQRGRIWERYSLLRG